MKDKKNAKMTLKEYYSSLPPRNAPRNEFVKEVARRCEVTEQTVRNWCIYGIRPRLYEHVKVLMELTGLEEGELWEL